ncbi:hypothetical protein GQ44DRAFT_702646 [Phaeosphaeriaceae sp. PMI808]|nr:hypothetical protein GQ44DRAFT_702646 [Phaeosphaeriaceae sp. PMI808]
MESNSNLKSRRHARNFSDEATNYVSLWSDSSFPANSSISDTVCDDEITVAWESTKQSVLPPIRRQPKPRPSPIYKDKRVEEYWGFLKSVPEIQTEQLPPPSRCPSLMSRGTLSSRNSSTRSTKSSILDPIDDQRNSTRGLDSISSCSDLWFQDEDFHMLRIPVAEPTLLECPVRACNYHSRGFASVADRKQHVFKHFNGLLQCGFCTKEEKSFCETADRVYLFLTHLIQEHGATGRNLELEPSGGRKSSFEGPIATCTVCAEPFSAQGFYEHLPGCIFRAVARNEHLQVRETLNNYDLSKSVDKLLDVRHALVSIPEPEEATTNIENLHGRLLPDSSIEFPDVECEDVVELTVSSRCLSLTSSKVVESSDEETDWTEEQTSRESSPGYSQLPRRLTPAKRKMVESIMQDFQRLSSQAFKSHTTAGGSSGSSYSDQSGWSSNASIYSTSSFVSRKRSLNSNKRQRSDRKSDDKRPVAELRFACPYYKRNPGKHQTFTSCRDPGFTTVARLKEHLYRRHLLPPQCHRCCTTFPNDIKLREHQRDPRGCEVHEQVPLEGFDKDQERQLKSKKKSQAYQTEEEKWKGVYRILFPDDSEDQIPTPYVEYQACTGKSGDASNVIRFQEFSRLELPRLVRRTLEAAVEHEAQPLEDRLKERLLDIIKECQGQLVSMFHATSGPNLNSSDSVTLPASAASVMSATTLPSTSCSLPAAHGIAGDIFEGFENIPMHISAVASVPQPAPPETMNAMTKLPASSNSSDSGYDSTWPPAQGSEPHTSTEDTNFTLQTDFNHQDYTGIDGYFGVFEDQTGPSATSSNEVIDRYSSTWALIAPIHGDVDTHGFVHRSLEELAPGWHM